MFNVMQPSFLSTECISGANSRFRRDHLVSAASVPVSCIWIGDQRVEAPPTDRR